MNPNTFLEGSDLYLSDPIVKSLKKKKKIGQKLRNIAPNLRKSCNFKKNY